MLTKLDFFSPLGECIWMHLPLIKSMLDFCQTIFPVCSYGFTTIPTYPSGQIGFILCSKNKVSFHLVFQPLDNQLMHMVVCVYLCTYLRCVYVHMCICMNVCVYVVQPSIHTCLSLPPLPPLPSVPPLPPSRPMCLTVDCVFFFSEHQIQ